MIIKNVKIFRDNKTFLPGAIELENGSIKRLLFQKENHKYEEELAGIAARSDVVMDGKDCYAVPGLIDIHFHGCKGYDFCDGTAKAIEEIANYQASVGVTAISPATMTLPVETLEQILSTAAEYSREKQQEREKGGQCKGADLLGINMEGPFISKIKKGAQDARYIIPCNADIFRRFQTAAQGLVKFIGVAPEEGDAPAFIGQVKDTVKVSLAHTNADYDCAKAAFDAGACHAVHLYNAMPPFTHREPGVIGAVSDSSHVMAELICDGIHIHPAVVRSTFRMLGEDRIILISDCMRATGMPDGQYTLGGLDVNVKGKRATLADGGALAGSVTNLMDCVRTVVKEMEIPLETAIACATVNPAKSLGVYGQYGSIDLGKRGNIVLLNENLELEAVIKDGNPIQ